MNYEIQILLGLNCNFKCRHCINESAPGNVSFDLNDDETNFLITEIISNKTVTNISFSGGEPLLYIEYISNIINSTRKVRPNLVFSITTNGSLIEKEFIALSILQIDNCVISYDEEHSDFFSNEQLTSSINIAKNVFRNVELNYTYFDFSDIENIQYFLLQHNIKINFCEKIKSGRNKFKKKHTKSTLKNLTCPNYKSTTLLKISFYPSKGFSICCGPIVFDKLMPDDQIYFKNLRLLEENYLFKFLSKARHIDLFLSNDISCHSCKEATPKFSQKDIEMFLNSNNWENLINFTDESELEKYNILFNPKFAKSAPTNTLRNPFAETTSKSLFKKISGDQITPNDINNFTEFTINTFYKPHQNYYSPKDINRFKEEQSVFFNLPHKYLFHFSDDILVGALVLCELKNHPFFKKPAWHIGYWGIDKNKTSSEARKSIKADWGKLLLELNKRSMIVANIDYFNKPADKMSKEFNFNTNFIRLDARR